MSLPVLVLLAASPVLAVLGFSLAVLGLIYALGLAASFFHWVALTEAMAGASDDGCALLVLPRVKLALLASGAMFKAIEIQGSVTDFGCRVLDDITVWLQARDL